MRKLEQEEERRPALFPLDREEKGLERLLLRLSIEIKCASEEIGRIFPL